MARSGYIFKYLVGSLDLHNVDTKFIEIRWREVKRGLRKETVYSLAKDCLPSKPCSCFFHCKSPPSILEKRETE